MTYYQEKIAIVTGGISGLGRSISIFLVQHGAKVFIADINLENLEEFNVYPIMKKQGYVQIINVSSLLGLIQVGLTSTYFASKHAVAGFSQTLRSESKQYNIKVNLLCPGQLKTNINVSEFMNSEKNI